MRTLICVLCGPEPQHWIVPDLALRLVEVGRQPGVEVATIFGQYGYSTARNRCVATFLQSGCELLLMLDNDTAPPSGFLGKVLEFVNSRPDADVICLPYYMRTNVDTPGHLITCCGHRTDNPAFFNLASQLPHTWTEIDVGGAGCMFVKRHVFDRMTQPFFSSPEYQKPEHLAGGPPSEDFAFCLNAKSQGFHVWTNGALMCDHFHTMNLLAMGRAFVQRQEEDIEYMRQLGIQIKTTRIVRASKDAIQD